MLRAAAQVPNSDQAPRVEGPDAAHWFERLAGPYQPKSVTAPRFQNSQRMTDLLRGGNLYLSLSDAIALAVENNLDVELERYGTEFANSDVLRAKGGGTLRGISLTVNELPQGVGGPASPLLNTPASGSLPGTTVTANLSEFTAIVPSTSGIDITGAQNFSTGPAIPLFDATLTGGLAWQRQNIPEVSPFLTGTPSAEGRTWSETLGVEQGFSTGTLVGANFNNSSQTSNSVRNEYNPYTTSSLGVTVTQPLLRGFGIAMNRRFIRIAQNNRRVTDLVFRQQVIATIAGVIRLYDDLVSLMEDVKVKQQTLALAQRLYEDNRNQVDQGTLAPVELTRAQAEVAAARQDLANSLGFEEQQELILKTVLSKRGTADPALRTARIIPTTEPEIPQQEAAQVVPDLVEQAMKNRPEMESARLEIENSRISLAGSRNALLPQLDLVATAQNAGLAGQINPAAAASGASLAPGTEQTFVGGVGTGLEQIFRGQYPSYSVGIQLTLPLRNRVAQADMIHDQAQLRQWEVRYQQLENQVRLEVESAVVALTRSRAAYDAAVDARRLQEQSLEIEMEKYAQGVSTTFLVMQYQGFVAQARSTEVSSRNVYVKARVSLERALGLTLPNHDITVADAYHGQLRRPPAAVP